MPQARRQIEAHAALMPRLSFRVWGRDKGKQAALVADLSPNIDVEPAVDLEAAIRQADIVITATGSTTAFMKSEWVQPGTHISAVGADAPGKQELDVNLIARADVLAVDIKSQCLDHGEVSRAAKSGLIQAEDVHEIGAILCGTGQGRLDADQISIADLTGIAAQDIAMANEFLAAWKAQTK